MCWQNRGLDATRIAKVLQDELVGGGGPLLAFLDLREIAVDSDSAAAGNATFRDLQPGPIGAAFQYWFSRVAMLRKAPPELARTTALGVLDQPPLCGTSDDLLVGHSGSGRPRAMIEQLGELVVAEYEPVLRVVKRSPRRSI